MSSGQTLDISDNWESRYNLIVRELEDSLLGKIGSECITIVEIWQVRYQDDIEIGFAVRQHASAFKSGYLKNNQQPSVHISGSPNSTVQVGSAQNSNSGNISTVVTAVNNSPPTETSAAISPTNSFPIANVIVALITALLALWWLAGPDYSYGYTRTLVTVFILTFVAVLLALSWIQFKRRNWEKFFLYSTATLLLSRSVLPSIKFFINADANLEFTNFLMKVMTYFSIEDDPWWTTLLCFLVSIFLFTLGFFRKTI